MNTEDLFQAVHERITARDAAERYGLTVDARGMALCPFHPDRHASMKVDRFFYCFACQEHGDAIDLTAKLLGLSLKQAALRLAEDFGIRVSDRTAGPAPERPPDPHRELSVWMDRAVRTLVDYERLLRRWERCFRPQRKSDRWHPLYCEAVLKIPRTDFLLDELLGCPRDSQAAMREEYADEIEQLRRYMAALRQEGQLPD